MSAVPPDSQANKDASTHTNVDGSSVSEPATEYKRTPYGNARKGSSIVARNLCASYRQGDLRVPVLQDAAFDIQAGSFTAITGQSGSGKTTLLSLLGALERPDSGTLNVFGHDLTNASRRQQSTYRRDLVGFVFQSFHLLPSLTALENVMAGLEPLHVRHNERVARSRAALEEVGLIDKAQRLPHQMSGGEQQRVAVARAVAKQPTLLLADEPTGNLDEEASEHVMACLMRNVRQDDSSPTLILVTHDAAIAARAERILVVQRRLVHDAAHVDLAST